MIRNKIKEAVKRQGITYSALASAIGVRKATISDYLNGHSEMKSDSLEKLFDFLGLNIRFK